VQVLPARLPELSESDSTHYFSASELLERGKALTARASEPAPPAAPQPSGETAAPPRRAGWLAQFRRASLARKAIALSLPLLCALLLARPRSEKPAPLGNGPSPRVATTAVTAAPKPALPPSTVSSAPPPTLPRGVTLVRAAADSVATGDFVRAASLYRELFRRQPTSQVYREAARILSERETPHTP